MEFVDLDDYYVFPLRGLTCDAEHTPQPDVGNGVSAKAEDSAGLGTALFRGQFRTFGDMLERNDKSFLAHPDREPFNDGEGQRQADGDGAALSGDTRYLSSTTQEIDIAADDVEADSAARKIGDRFGG